jgi:hypothetical protein
MPILSENIFINDTLNSIQYQTYKNWELIIGINGLSNDSGIHKIVKKYESSDVRIKVLDLFELKNNIEILNEMIKHSKTEWVTILNIGDKWLPKKIENQMCFTTEYDIIGCQCKYIGDSNDTPFIPLGDLSDLDFSKLNPIVTGSYLIRKDIYTLNTKEFESKDYNLWLKLRNEGKKFYNVKDVQLLHRIYNSVINEKVIKTNENKLLVVLTQYKRNHLEKQLRQINSQTIKPDYLVVFQNENHIDVSHLKEKYDFIHIKSDYNTKYFGRFASCFTFPVDICMVLDDDIIPGNNCLKNYMEQCIDLNSIIGGNGRFGINNTNIDKSKLPRDSVLTETSTLVDFVGHAWCFKKEWLHYMFSIKPFTYDTGEDMHLCFSSKVLGNIKSYIAKQSTPNDNCDITCNSLAGDEHSSFIVTKPELRNDVEKYFIKKYNIEFVKN